MTVKMKNTADLILPEKDRLCDLYGQYIGFGSGSSGGPPLSTNLGVHLASGNEYDRGAALSNSPNSKMGTLSFWAKVPDLTAEDQTHNVIGSGTGHINIRFPYDGSTSGTASHFQITMYTSASGSCVGISSSANSVEEDEWVHVAACWNTTTGSQETHVFINGTEDSVVVTNTADALAWWQSTSFEIGDDGFSDSGWLRGDLFDLWLDTQVYFDLTVASNLEKFIYGGKPVDLGSDGSTPTGSAPTIFMRVESGGSASDFATNRGDGGGMTAVGSTIALSSTNPT